MQEKYSQYIYRVLLAAAVATIATGTIVYHVVEKFSWLNSYYFSVVTLATVGYGDISPKTAFGKIFTTFYIFVGVGILTTFLSYAMKKRAYKFDTRKQARANHQEKQD